MACVGRTKECTIVPSNHYGPIPGIPVGTMWRFRVQVPTVDSLGPRAWLVVTGIPEASAPGRGPTLEQVAGLEFKPAPVLWPVERGSHNRPDTFRGSQATGSEGRSKERGV